MDLRATASAVLRLPFDSDRLTDILCESEPTAANKPEDEDHTIFWLILADQFAKRSILCDRVRDKALNIIDSGADVALHEKCGMKAADLRKRQKMLTELRQRITAPAMNRSPRVVLKKPQALRMDVGDIYVYPTCGGRCINAYAASRELDREGSRAPIWTQDGWAALMIVDRGRAFDFLSWYRPLTIASAMLQKPVLADLRGDLLWRLAHAGTCSPLHFERMEFEKIGALQIDDAKLRRSFPDMRPGTRAAIGDISITNGVSVGPRIPAEMMPRPGAPVDLRKGRPYPTILGLAEILAGPATSP